jgi:transcriptional regulator with XRE-family HTH domain
LTNWQRLVVMTKRKHRRLPPLTDFRIRRLKARLPLDVLAVQSGVPSASLSRFERGEHSLSQAQLTRLEKALGESET